MPDDMQERIRARIRGNRVNSPDNRSRSKMILQKRILLRTVLKSRTTSRSRTRAASVALPKLFIWGPGLVLAGPLFHTELIETQLSQEEVCQTTA